MTVALAVAPCVLSIAGSDPSGGAGVQADLRTFAALGVDAGAAIAVLTAQNAREVLGVLAVPVDFITLQIDAVFAERDIAAVKVGMLGDASAVRAVAAALRAHRPRHVVVDPVLRSTSGTVLLAPPAVEVLRRALLPLATVVTPNAAEAGVLLERAAPATVREMREAAQALCALGPTWVLVTGGHVAAGADCVDVLSGVSGLHELRTLRIPGAERHGTGCVLSSAIAAYLARGWDVRSACAAAQEFVAAMLAAASTRKVGDT